MIQYKSILLKVSALLLFQMSQPHHNIEKAHTLNHSSKMFASNCNVDQNTMIAEDLGVEYKSMHIKRRGSRHCKQAA